MKTNEVLKMIDDKAFIDKIYQYAYRRCSSSYEAEDLCSDIILAVLSAVNKTEYIESFYAFVWTVAKRVYADFCAKRRKTDVQVSIENDSCLISDEKNEIEELIEEADQQERLNRIFKEIAFLSKSYREVMVMFYIDELSVKEIAKKLGSSETAIKQRLFSARNTIRKEAENMENRNLSLKPIRFKYIGTGDPVGNEPSTTATRLLSQNLIYLCKDKAKSAKELADELCVPMQFVEEELEIQCRGWNGEYGMLRKLENGKYISNVIIADYKEYVDCFNLYKKYIPALCDIIKKKIEEDKEKILSFPYLSKQEDIKLPLWPLLYNLAHNVVWKINNLLKEKYFADVKPACRPYTQVAIAYTDAEWENNSGRECYGCDGIIAYEFCGYKSVNITNIYGPALLEHFHCGHNLSTDPLLYLTVRAIGGLDIDTLSEAEKEGAAKAIECGYLRKNGNILEPKVVVIDYNDKKAFNEFSTLRSANSEIAEAMAKEFAEFIKTHIPQHLINDYSFYLQLIATPKTYAEMMQHFIDEGIITLPEGLGAEGVVITVEK